MDGSAEDDWSRPRASSYILNTCFHYVVLLSYAVLPFSSTQMVTLRDADGKV